jgi:hypothetical protein
MADKLTIGEVSASTSALARGMQRGAADGGHDPTMDADHDDPGTESGAGRRGPSRVRWGSMKKPLLALGLVATAIAISRLPEDKRENLSRVARTIMEH